jgi:hyperpolarization activated cyclic nucleotide-gated potassium channel 1
MRVNPGVTRLLRVMIMVGLLVHLMSCLWYLVAKFQDFSEDAWVAQNELMDSSIGHKYVSSMYWAFQTLTTVGYGDVISITVYERVVSLIWIVFGVIFYSFTIGSLQSIIRSFDSSAQELQMKQNTLQEFSKRVKLPDETKLKIEKFLENNKNNQKQMSEGIELIRDLPAIIRSDLIYEMHGDIISQVKVFQGKDTEFLWRLFPHLKAIRTYFGDILYN